MRNCIIIILVSLVYPVYAQQTGNQRIDTSEYIYGEPNINLLIAADKGYPTEVTRLLNQGAEVGYTTFDGVTALMYAAQRGHEEVVKVLLEKGADPNKKPSDGNSALHGAAMFNQLDVVEILLNNGADIDIQNKKEVTPLMIAAGYDYFILADMLLFYGADPSIKDKSGNNALLTATHQENVEIVALLLDQGASVNVSDDKGFTPLMIAVQYNNPVLTDLFIEYNADVDEINTYGYNALTYAIINENEKLVRRFIDLGADVNTNLDYASTPLTIARQTGNDSIKNMLLEYGAKRNPYPDFSDLNVGPMAVFNTEDFRMGLSFQLNEAKYGVGIVGSWDIRPSRKRIWRERESETYYQFWETRQVLTAGLQKTFVFNKKNLAKYYAFHVGARAGYTYGNYRGYIQNAASKTFFTPEAGLTILNPRTTFKIGYTYIPLDNENVSPHQIKIEYLFTIFLNNKRYKNKNIRWLE